MMTGRMHNAEVVHVGRKAKSITDRDGKNVTLYAPFCQRVDFRTIAYLGVTHEEVTCKKCLKLMTTKPHLFT